MQTLLLLIGGLGLLTIGGEILVRGAVGLARRLHVSEMLIGLTLVGFGTSTPELITSLNAAFAGSPGIALGNVVGSNIANILLILGIVVLIRPVPVDKRALQRDGVVLALATAAAIGIGVVFGGFTRIAGLILLAGLVAFLYLAWRGERRNPAEQGLREAEAQSFDPAPEPIWLAIVFAIGGLAALIFGADFLVEGAVRLAKSFGVSETVIGLTIVAVGTSLPELVASLAAALRGRSEVAFGNILGSNIYNILGILGLTALVHPFAVPGDMGVADWAAMAIAAALFLFHAATGARIGRVEGAIYLLLYGVYCAILL